MAARTVRGRLLLVVDDEPDIAVSLQNFLEMTVPDVQVLTASSGAAALEILRRQRIDLILTDYRMPGMNGLGFLEQATVVAPHVPRILLTAFPDIQLALQALQEHHVAHFFRKPYDPDEVRDIVVAILDNCFTGVRRAKAFQRSLEIGRSRP